MSKTMTVEQALARIREFNHKNEARAIEKELTRLREFEWMYKDLSK